MMVISGVSVLTLNACAQTKPVEAIHLVASTPADSSIRQVLRIPFEDKVDFIKWDLQLKDDSSFLLHINYGEGQPNTSGFYNGGVKNSFNGKYSISPFVNGYELIILHSLQLGKRLMLAKLNGNLFQIMDADGRFERGNAGWSYTLNRKQVLADDGLPASFFAGWRTEKEMTFEGRTPCKEIAGEYGFTVPAECFKLKWQLVLYTDSLSGHPAGYVIRRTDSRQKEITGEWEMSKMLFPGGAAFIIKLDPNKPGKSLSFFMADENTLYILNRKGAPYVGNELFSYTLNRRSD